MNWQGLDVVELAPAYGFDRKNGVFTTRRWRGISASAQSLYNGISASGEADSFEINPQDDGTAIVTARFSRDTRAISTEIPVNQFELIGQKSTVDIKEHPKVVALGPAVISTVDVAFEELQRQTAGDASSSYSSLTGTITTAALAANVSQADALDLFDHLIKGVRNIPRPTWVLRHSKTVSDAYGASAKQSFTNAGKLVFYPVDGAGSRSTIMDAELAAAGTPIPATILFRLDDISAPSSVPTGYHWGWVKEVPNVRPTALNKWEVVQEWILDAIDTFIYDSL
jgi:hypothetical protein